MKKISVFFFAFSLVLIPLCHADATRHFHGEGEVLSVDPLYSRITIEHAPIKGFPGDAQNEFVVSSPDLLKKISKSDLVSFDIEETRGDAQIVKIERTGIAPTKPDGVPLGAAAKEVLDGAGNVVKTVAAPIAPVGEVATGATSATGSAVTSVEPRVSDGNVESKTKF